MGIGFGGGGCGGSGPGGVGGVRSASVVVCCEIDSLGFIPTSKRSSIRYCSSSVLSTLPKQRSQLILRFFEAVASFLGQVFPCSIDIKRQH